MNSSNEIVLALNTGSTSTKVALFGGEKEFCAESIQHTVNELAQFRNLWDQLDFRLNAIRGWISKSGRRPAAVASVGGLLKPLDGGVYIVNDRMIADARSGVRGQHASNLGCSIAFELAKSYECRSFVVDPVSVDEFEPLARYSGHPEIERNSLSHALNIHSVARRAARESGTELINSRFVVAHLGGGISVAAVKGGRIIDVNDASSDGPFSPERTGGLPLQQFISLCFSHTFNESEMKSLVMGRGGLVAYLGTNSASDVESRIRNGDNKSREVYEAMAYQIAKEIGAMSTVLNGKVNAIILTGGLANSSMLLGWLRDRVGAIAPVIVYPGEDEMRSLAMGALRVLRGEEQAKEY